MNKSGVKKMIKSLKQIVLATNNKHKLKEFSDIFVNSVNFLTLKEIGFNRDIIEDGNSFIENSIKKCKAVYDFVKSPVMADDSGLCVEALDYGPGIYSARYGGKGLSDKDRYMHLLENLKGKTNLNASFVCALVLMINPVRFYIVQEEKKGIITFNPKGGNGFGYDPVLDLPEFKKTVAELPDGQKHKISHRGKACKMMKKIINKITLL